MNGRSDEVLREKTRVLIGPEPALVINRGLVNYWRGRVCVNPSLTALQHPLLSRPLYSLPSAAPRRLVLSVFYTLFLPNGGAGKNSAQ